MYFLMTAKLKFLVIEKIKKRPEIWRKHAQVLN